MVKAIRRFIGRFAGEGGGAACGPFGLADPGTRERVTRERLVAFSSLVHDDLQVPCGFNQIKRGERESS